MSIFRSLAALLVVASSALLAGGCAPSGGEGTASEDTSDVEDGVVGFQLLDVRKSESPAGLTVIKSRSAYRQFFGAEPPQGVNFSAHWVLHSSMGVQMTGGYATEIESIDKVGSGSARRLVVTTENTSPGWGCMVTQALTNPQVTVRINKHPGATVESEIVDVSVNCEDPNDSFCTRVRCAKGTQCSEEERACVPASCDPSREGDLSDCGVGQECTNLIRCITAPCPEDFRCNALPEDPCQGLDFNGECRDNAATWCEEGALQSLACGPDGTCDASSGFADCL